MTSIYDRKESNTLTPEERAAQRMGDKDGVVFMNPGESAAPGAEEAGDSSNSTEGPNDMFVAGTAMPPDEETPEAPPSESDGPTEEPAEAPTTGDASETAEGGEPGESGEVATSTATAPDASDPTTDDLMDAANTGVHPLNNADDVDMDPDGGVDL
jgi:hypothetical protein